MEFLYFLIGLPIVGSLIALVLPVQFKNVAVIVASVTVGCASILYAFNFYTALPTGTTTILGPSIHNLDTIVYVINLFLCFVIIRLSMKYKKVLPAILAFIQAVIEIAFETYFNKEALAHNSAFTVDALTVIMVLIIGVVGGGICIYATGYMHDFQKHQPKDANDRRGQFFFLCIIFLAAMFLIVFSNNMSYMFCGWEITTVCSFLLIGYTKTDEAINNSFLQINFNLIGGIAFAGAMIYSAIFLNTLEFSEFLNIAAFSNSLVQIPLVLFSIAALTKAAQAPFHTWLLGAMVAPTPTSALLHSSTMVKAGVFLLIKLSPAFAIFETVGLLVALVGGTTFLFASMMAISQSNGKRVLAYSTIANLGLIVLCAGLGDENAVWAAIMLLIFHAIAKSLLFLCVGTAEHHIGSRDIESFDLLFNKMPQLSRFMMLGILIMFIAPFGMLIAKWGVIASLATRSEISLLLILAFGSAATFMYWAKWLGKLAAISSSAENIESTVTRSENGSLYLMGILLIITNVGLPFISQFMVIPEIQNLFNNTTTFTITTELLMFAALITFVVILVLFLGIGKKRNEKELELKPYLAGITVDADSRSFKSIMQPTLTAETRNFYLENEFGEKLTPYAQIFATVIILINIGLAIFQSGVI